MTKTGADALLGRVSIILTSSSNLQFCGYSTFPRMTSARLTLNAPVGRGPRPRFAHVARRPGQAKVTRSRSHNQPSAARSPRLRLGENPTREAFGVSPGHPLRTEQLPGPEPGCRRTNKSCFSYFPPRTHVTCSLLRNHNRIGRQVSLLPFPTRKLKLRPIRVPRESGRATARTEVYVLAQGDLFYR